MRITNWLLAGVAGVGISAATLPGFAADEEGTKPKVGDQAPEWSLEQLLQTDKVKAEDLKWDHEALKDKAVVLEFWFST